ncbi:MAG TPA: hypothetical protein VJK07_01475 [Candidatus Nanoarchaeia archaeon]|nr:hypothetical protein [Candidatus Nanoarchaeia archaeon]
MVVAKQNSSNILLILLIITLIFSVASLVVTLNVRSEFRSGYQFVQPAPSSSGGTPNGNVGLVVNPPASGGAP